VAFNEFSKGGIARAKRHHVAREPLGACVGALRSRRLRKANDFRPVAVGGGVDRASLKRRIHSWARRGCAPPWCIGEWMPRALAIRRRRTLACVSVSVLIPTHGRPDKLRACLDGLARQRLAADEVIVGLDGGTPDEAAELERVHSESLRGTLRVMTLPRRGYQSTRKRMLEAARAPIFLSLNDDVHPDPALVMHHARAHEHLDSPAKPAAVAGAVRWAPIEHPTVFDEVVCRSDMVFFQQAPGAEGPLPEISWRQCFGLNFSAPTGAALAAGGFHDLPFEYGYDDIELAYRMSQRGAAVRLARNAMVAHDHRFAPIDVQRREYLLGRAAWAYRQVAPEFSEALFGRDIASADALAFAQQYLARMRADAERIERTIEALGSTALESSPLRDPMPQVIAEHWVLLKRYLWNWGLLDAASGQAARFVPLSEAGALP
jgi:hypothetical protein